MAKVEEVKAFKSIDGEVFDTFQKAHSWNIRHYCRRLFGAGDSPQYNDDYDVAEKAAELLHQLLIHPHNSRTTKVVLAALAKELE